MDVTLPMTTRHRTSLQMSQAIVVNVLPRNT